MTTSALTSSCLDGAITLERADRGDIEAVMALQAAAYAHNRQLLGLEPLPLLADYAEIFGTHEVWIHRIDHRLVAALIIETRTDDLLIWSIASDPGSQRKGLGRQLLLAAERRARQLGHSVIRLYTGSTLKHLIDWYQRHGYRIERLETLEDRSITHMAKHLAKHLNDRQTPL